MKKDNKIKMFTITLITAIIMAVSSITVYSNVCAPKFYDYFIDTGVKYLMDGKYEEAILAFNKAIEIEEKSTEARVYLAQGYIGNNEPEKAIEVLKEAQDLDITNEELLKEILEILNEIDADIAYEFLDRFINAVGQENISEEIKDMLNSAYEAPINPIVDPAPGTYIKSISVKLKLDKIKVGHSFYYTTDGSEPSKSSQKYRGKIDIDKTTTIKLIGYNKNEESTEIITLDYIIDTTITEHIQDLINESNNLIDNTKVGTSVGNCVEGSKEKFMSSIGKIKELFNKEIINYDTAIDIKSSLDEAMQTFKNNIIEETDKLKLKDKIQQAQQIYDSSKEGRKETEYKIGSKKVLQQAIHSAKEVYENILSKQGDIDKEVISLEKSIRNFEKSKNKNLSDLKNKYINKIKELESRDANLEYLSMDMSNGEMGDYLWNIYEAYEVLLNAMNTELKDYLNDNELIILNNLKNKWIVEKKKAEDDFDRELSESPGTWAVTGEPSSYITVINKHCYEVIKTLMN